MKERYLGRSVPLQTGPLWSLQLFLAAVELASTQCTATAWQEASNNFGNKFGWMVGQLVGCLVSWFCGWLPVTFIWETSLGLLGWSVS